MARVALQRCAGREVLAGAVAHPCAGQPAHVLHAAAPVPHPGEEQGVQPLRGDSRGPQEGELLSACNAPAGSHMRAADVLVGSHETSSGLCAAACTLCARDADQAEQAPPRSLDADQLVDGAGQGLAAAAAVAAGHSRFVAHLERQFRKDSVRMITSNMVTAAEGCEPLSRCWPSLRPRQSCAS